MVTILDGGMGQELVRRTGKITPLWAVQALLDAPEVVRAVHDDYFAAGADIATTNTYNLMPDRLGMTETDRLDELTALAGAQAVQARDAHGAGLVAGSIGPLRASYRPDLAPSAEQAAEEYAALARAHAGFADFHILETIPSVDLAKGGLMGAALTGKPVWLALTVDDADGTKLRSGEPVADVLPVIAAHAPGAVLVNCAPPEAVTRALEILAPCGRPLGGYANGFVKIDDAFLSPSPTVDVLHNREDLTPDRYGDFAAEWIAAGATIVGGCCEVGPDHIRVLTQRFKLEAVV